MTTSHPSNLTSGSQTQGHLKPQPQSQPRTAANSVIIRLAQQWQIEPVKLWDKLQTTVFKPDRDGKPFTQDDVWLVLMMAEQYNLNVLRREIYAFRSYDGSIKAIVSIDGWKAIMLRQKDFDGYEITYSDNLIKAKCGEVPEWAEATIWKKNCSHPIRERVYFKEVFVDRSLVWNKSPRLMLHHRALIQAIRFAFPISGIADEGYIDNDSDFEKNAQSEAQALATAQNPTLTPEVKMDHLETARLESFATRAIAIARQQGNYDTAFAMANRLQGEAAQYVTQRLASAQAEDAMISQQEIHASQAMQMHAEDIQENRTKERKGNEANDVSPVNVLSSLATLKPTSTPVSTSKNTSSYGEIEEGLSEMDCEPF